MHHYKGLFEPGMVVHAFRRHRQADLCVFMVSLVYRVRTL